MASPNFDNLHLLLSRKIGDPVSAAGTDGLVTSALRTDYLNRANKFIQLYFKGRPDVELWLSGLVGQHAITAFASAGFALPTDFQYELNCKKNGTTSDKDVVLKFFSPDKKTALDNGSNPNNQDGFLIFGGLIYAYESGRTLSSGAGVLRYIKNDQRTSSGDTSDILINSLWYDTIVSIAAMFHFVDKAELDFAAAQKQMVDMILAVAK